MPRRRKRNSRSNRALFPILRKPAMQLVIVAFTAFIVYLIALGGGGGSGQPPAEVNVDEAYQMAQGGAFILDVRTQEEWDEYHVPNATLIPLDQLQNRLAEVPRDRRILVVCRSGNRSREGRDILLSAGFEATSMDGGLREWYAKGYPIEGVPVQ